MMSSGTIRRRKASHVILSVAALIFVSGASDTPARNDVPGESIGTVSAHQRVRWPMSNQPLSHFSDLQNSPPILRVTNSEDKFLYEGFRQLNKRSYDRAMRNFHMAMQQNPESPEAYRGIALIYWHRDRDMQASGVYFRIALSKPMVTPDLNVDYARYLATLNRLDDSLEHLYKTLDRWPKARNVRSQIALLYYQKKNQMKACKWANNALEHDDDLQAGLLERACGYA